jgi:HD-GYP domain-containing protein (c-di-GMP phosphodiesterase class II)
LIHDVGKIGIPDSVLRKPGRLTDEEADMIRQHPVFGANMIQDIGLFQECLPIVRSHHERLDGTGYPDGLCGSEIPLLVRICTVADMFDAMTSSRVYRKGMEVGKAMNEVRRDAENGAVDPIVAAALDTSIAEYGLLDSGEDYEDQQFADDEEAA